MNMADTYNEKTITYPKSHLFGAQPRLLCVSAKIALGMPRIGDF